MIEDGTRGPGRKGRPQSLASMAAGHVYSHLPQEVRVRTEGSDADDLPAVNRDRCNRDIPALTN